MTTLKITSAVVYDAALSDTQVAHIEARLAVAMRDIIAADPVLSADGAMVALALEAEAVRPQRTSSVLSTDRGAAAEAMFLNHQVENGSLVAIGDWRRDPQDGWYQRDCKVVSVGEPPVLAVYSVQFEDGSVRVFDAYARDVEGRRIGVSDCDKGMVDTSMRR